MTNHQSMLMILLVLVLFSACKKDSINTIHEPESYEFLRNGESTVSFSGQTTRIGMMEELFSAMTEMEGNEVWLSELYHNQTIEGTDANPYQDPTLNESTKSISSKVAASRDFFGSNTVESAEIKSFLSSLIAGHSSEIFPNRNELASHGQAGQIIDGSTARYVNGKGMEYNQVMSKSLIGALMVDQMLNNYLSTSVLDEASNIEENNQEILLDGKSYTNMEHKWDEAFGYLFGAPGADYSNPLNTLGFDNFLNKYLSRVDDDSDFAGIADEIFQAFKLGRAAIVAGEYQVRDQQAEIIREKISEVIAIRSVYYLQQGKNALTENKFGTAFHDLSEGLGFIYSLRFTRRSNINESYFDRTEVDGFVNQLLNGNGFWDLEATTLDQISEEIAAKFSFTVAQAAQ